MKRFRVEFEADCVALDGQKCDDGEVNLECLECGDSGGACAYLCIDKAKELK